MNRMASSASQRETCASAMRHMDSRRPFTSILVSSISDLEFFTNLKVHHSKPGKAWVKEHAEEIEVFFLPSYSPELNPDERLNADLKSRSQRSLRPEAGRSLSRSPPVI
jgi:hypothetical protein